MNDAVHADALQAVQDRACPVCGSEDIGGIFVEQNLDPGRLDRFSYSSRKTPEFMSHRLVRCAGCDAIYAPRVPSAEVLARAYRDAAFDSADEARLAAMSYASALGDDLRPLSECRGALEIGAGTGAFLHHLREAGFAPVVGVEPSAAAIDAADDRVKSLLRREVFVPEKFDAGSFSLVASFQTLEHISEPLGVARAAFRLLAPGGRVAFVAHDHRAWLNRLLGRRSPIVDIEHLQLFSAASIATMLAAAGFERVRVRPIRNVYPLRYWLRLLPVPRPLKKRILAFARITRLAHLELGARVGNVLALGIKPGA